MSEREYDGQTTALPPLGDAHPVSTTPRPPSRPSKRGESPGGVIAVGLFVSLVLGGFLIVLGNAGDVGLLVLLGDLVVVVGSVITMVGVIAAGVRLGMRWARIDEGS